jgi:hypothetical protein
MKRMTTGWKRARALLLPGMFLAVLPASGCEDAIEEACGPCGKVSTGDYSVSGNAELDGFFQAVGTFHGAAATVTSQFQADLGEIAALYSIEAKADGTFDAGAVEAAIKADFDANLQGGINVNYVPPKCEASLDVSIEAQAQCEAKAECTGEFEPGSVEVKCEGSCTGECKGGCEGTAQCELEVTGGACTTKCEGSCELKGSVACEGTCRGTCSGSCEVRDAQGQCAGKCEGNCTGSCEASVAATCNGTCTGKCTAPTAEASCSGTVKCEGKCTGSCTGGCSGNFKPPSARVDCEASAKCEAQASARANAALVCLPPTLDISYGFKASANASARTSFNARMAVIKAKGSSIVQGFAKLRALIDGKVEIDGKLVTAFNPSPFVQLQDSLEGSISAVANFEIAPGRLPCVVPAFEEAVSALADASTGLSATVAGQTKIVAVLTTGG